MASRLRSPHPRSGAGASRKILGHSALADRRHPKDELLVAGGLNILWGRQHADPEAAGATRRRQCRRRSGQCGRDHACRVLAAANGGDGGVALARKRVDVCRRRPRLGDVSHASGCLAAATGLEDADLLGDTSRSGLLGVFPLRRRTRGTALAGGGEVAGGVRLAQPAGGGRPLAARGRGMSCRCRRCEVRRLRRALRLRRAPVVVGTVGPPVRGGLGRGGRGRVRRRRLPRQADREAACGWRGDVGDNALLVRGPPVGRPGRRERGDGRALIPPHGLHLLLATAELLLQLLGPLPFARQRLSAGLLGLPKLLLNLREPVLELRLQLLVLLAVRLRVAALLLHVGAEMADLG
mmetsp:Transcript_56907/g.160613  ORF Transcript_56907/g.160613 Transcript_56907/m.160613 type:complete len:352 (-) Transcript_56907:831-1886(-)